jgi:hypothetical protein
MADLEKLVDEYLAFVFTADPIEATRLGVHDYDLLLGDLTPDAIGVPGPFSSPRHPGPNRR